GGGGGVVGGWGGGVGGGGGGGGGGYPGGGPGPLGGGFWGGGPRPADTPLSPVSYPARSQSPAWPPSATPPLSVTTRPAWPSCWLGSAWSWRCRLSSDFGYSCGGPRSIGRSGRILESPQDARLPSTAPQLFPLDSMGRLATGVADTQSSETTTLDCRIASLWGRKKGSG